MKHFHQTKLKNVEFNLTRWKPSWGLTDYGEDGGVGVGGAGADLDGGWQSSRWKWTSTSQSGLGAGPALFSRSDRIPAKKMATKEFFSRNFPKS